MTASDSQISVSNRSLLAIGARAYVSSLSEGSTESDAISILFQPTFEQLARTAQWNCLRNQATLTLLAAAQGTPENPNGTTLPLPPTPWLYSYALPSDCLDMRYIVPNVPVNSGVASQTTVNNGAATWLPDDGAIDFAVGYSVDSNNNPIQVILTDQTQAIAVYTVNQPNVVVWDSLFSQAFVAALAAYLCPALNNNTALMQMQVKMAEAAIAQARVRDGDEGTTSQDHVPDWLKARTSGSYYNSNASSQGGYYNMIWPTF